MYEQILETASFIRQRTSVNPEIAIICGSGLGGLTQNISDTTVIPYSEIPNFALSSVKGHKGQLVIGSSGGKSVVAMQGRFHFYEGYAMHQVTFPVRVMKALGAKQLIVTNAAGGLNPDFKTGDIMLIKDHINLMPNPLIGKNDDRLGERFPSINGVYDRTLREKFLALAKGMNVSLKQGVYLGLTGPSFETSAENRFFRQIGADCVGMSTTPEVIVAAHEGLKVLAASLISNIFIDGEQSQSTHDEVLDAVCRTSAVFQRLVEDLIAAI